MENLIEVYRNVMETESEEEAMKIFVKSYERGKERRETINDQYGMLETLYQKWKKELGE